MQIHPSFLLRVQKAACRETTVADLTIPPTLGLVTLQIPVILQQDAVLNRKTVLGVHKRNVNKVCS